MNLTYQMSPKIEDKTDFKASFSADDGIFVAFIGYEARSLFLTELANTIGLSDPILTTLEENACTHSFDKNREKVEEMGYRLKEFQRGGVRTLVARVLMRIRGELQKPGPSRVSVHIDYSSMPRDWYCMLFIKLVKGF